MLLHSGLKYMNTPATPSQVYQVGDNEGFTGYLLVARNVRDCDSCTVSGIQGGKLDPALFIPIKEVLPTPPPTFPPITKLISMETPSPTLSAHPSDSSGNIRGCPFLCIGIATIFGALMA